MNLALENIDLVTIRVQLMPALEKLSVARGHRVVITRRRMKISISLSDVLRPWSIKCPPHSGLAITLSDLPMASRAGSRLDITVVRHPCR